ncbi:hypothetical protein BDZ94DRAFT_1304218 [Collybia nuda]|uniref:Vacuolar ATPase assembly integral membrane protein VMA21 homolog n=1 Tax=Collybia nuda TaxID=64659 RepID=A0A9P5YGY4_9AGAR|nr:hypothetical protein BDZ94DRAFT_1304218 [Collybia nuda]
MSEQAAMAKITKNSAEGGILVKLLIFSISLGVVPLSSYFGSLKYIWNGNSTYAAITAVVSANIVLITYIVSSLLEDRQPITLSQKSLPETKKQR